MLQDLARGVVASCLDKQRRVLIRASSVRLSDGAQMQNTSRGMEVTHDAVGHEPSVLMVC